MKPVPARFGVRRSAVLVVALLVAMALGGADGDRKPADKPGPGGLRWYPLGDGLKLAKKERRPVLFVAVAAKAPFWTRLEEELFASKSVLGRLERFVPATADPALDGAEPPPPLTVKGLLGDLRGKPAVALLDFRGRVLKRWDDVVPARIKFVKGLKHAAARNEDLARTFGKVEKDLRRVRYGLEIKKYREAVLALLRARAAMIPPQSETGAAITELQAKLEALYLKGEKEAKKLEKDRKLAAAIARYERLIKEFPFPDKVTEWRKKVAELWRRTQWR